MSYKKLNAFSLLEIMIVIAIIALLTMFSVPSFMRFLAKAKRTEAYLNLRSLYMAEKAYWLEHGRYTTKLTGADSCGWQPEGALAYTYGFNGAPGVECFVGTLKAPASALQGSQAGQESLTIIAAADIDNDGKLDILAINEKGVITVLEDDLQ